MSQPCRFFCYASGANGPGRHGYGGVTIMCETHRFIEPPPPPGTPTPRERCSLGQIEDATELALDRIRLARGES